MHACMLPSTCPFCRMTGVSYVLLQHDGGWTDTKKHKESAQRVNSGEENSPASSARVWTHDLPITSPALYEYTDRAIVAHTRFHSPEAAALNYLVSSWSASKPHGFLFYFFTCDYGVVPKGLLTFLGSLYREIAKTTSGTLVYRFERQTARKKILPSKNTVSSIWM